MKNYNEVSIVIPTYNRADFLIQCIDSCLAQTHPCEIIVCDHGSTDNTPEIMKRYQSKVRYIRREHDSGVHFCWMDGIISAKHNLIHLQFDDDWLLPTYIEKCLELFNDQVGFVIAEACIYEEKTATFGGRLFNFHSNTGIYRVAKIRNHNLRYLTSPCAGIYRKDILMDNLFIGKVPFINFEYKGVGPDILFTLMSCMEHKKYGYVHEVLVIFRAHEGSITVDAAKNIDTTKKIEKAYHEARIFYRISQMIHVLHIRDIINIYTNIIHLGYRLLSKIKKIILPPWLFVKNMLTWFKTKQNI